MPFQNPIVIPKQPTGRFSKATKFLQGTVSLFLCFLLWGCSPEGPPAETTSIETTVVPTIPSVGLYAPAGPLEQATSGAVRSYPLGISDARELLFFGEGLLLFSGEDTTLTLLAGEALVPQASLSLGFPLSAQDPSVQLHGKALSYYDGTNQETVVLDSDLTPVSHIPAPTGLLGTPLLSQDRNTLYYCTAKALMAWDLEADIHRTVKEMSYPGQSVVELLAQDQVIQCLTEDGYQFLSADTGRLVSQWDSGIRVETRQAAFYAAFPVGFDNALVFGTGEDIQILLPDQPGDTFFLPQNQVLISACQPGENTLLLDCYDLSTGLRQSQLRLETGVFPLAISGSDGYVYLLMEDESYGCDVIHRWEPAALPINDGTDYTHPYIRNPQEKDFAACQAYAEELANQYGITILLGKAAAATEPWDYQLEAEIQPAILTRELQLLEQRLSPFPPEILQKTAQDFSSLNLCLVRSVTGSPEAGSTGSATGVQFLDGSDAYVAIACGRLSQQALYHELFHAMETHIFTYSIAFDQWDTLNPTGFQYDYSYASNASRDSGIYLQTNHRAFIDTYSMSFPKEDRARIFEYAIQEGNEDCFETEAMQAKLRCLCEGIREAYGLEKSPDSYRWEQYLKKSLAYSK